MKIVIVGAGLGGLTAAVGLAKDGHDVQVLERSRKFGPRGGGINVRPAATRILHSWGLRPALEEISEVSPDLILRSVTTGRITLRSAQRSAALDPSTYPEWATSRRDLVQALYRAASDLGATIRFGAPVVDARDEAGSDQAVVVLDTGEEISADLIVAADGARSTLRPKILSDLGLSTEPLLSDITFYRIELPAGRLKSLVGESQLTSRADLNIWVGDGIFVVSRYDTKTGEAGTLYGIRAETDQKDLWDDKGDIGFVRDRFSGACVELTSQLQATDYCDRWRLAELPDLPRWTSAGPARIVLLGDAAHAMHPNAAQGYSQTVEDAAVLQTVLNGRKPGTSVGDMTGTWQAIRKPRVDRIKRFAKWNTKVFIQEAEFLSRPRESSSTRTLKDVLPEINAPFQSSAFLRWVMEYDAVKETEKILAAADDSRQTKKSSHL